MTPKDKQDKQIRKGQIAQIHFLCESIGQECPRMKEMTADEAAIFITNTQHMIKELERQYGEATEESNITGGSANTEPHGELAQDTPNGELDWLREILNGLAGEHIPGWTKREKAVAKAEQAILSALSDRLPKNLRQERNSDDYEYNLGYRRGIEDVREALGIKEGK